MKHYLRGEEGIRYEDLYHLAKYLPAYTLPAGKPNPNNGPFNDYTNSNTPHEKPELPFPSTIPIRSRFNSVTSRSRVYKGRFNPDGSPVLLPSRNPPKFSIWDVFPFTLLVNRLTKKGYHLGGRAAQRARAKLGLGRGVEGEVLSHNVPLEITLYLAGCFFP